MTKPVMNLQRRTLRAALQRMRDAVGNLPEGLVYRMAADFVLRHGVWYFPTRSASLVKGPPKLCFGTSIMNAVERGWSYCEGYALPKECDLPIHHAWNLLPDGTVEDSTWHNRGRAYLGVVFSWGRADDATWNGDACILDDWKRRWPLFRQEWTGEDFSREWEPSPAVLAMREGSGVKQALLIAREKEDGNDERR